MGSSPALDKSALERAMAGAEARQKLNTKDKQAWDAFRTTVRPFVYFNKILVAWTLSKGQPQILDIFTVTSANISFQDGLWIVLESKVKDEEVIIDHTPRRLSADLQIFGWMPFFNEMRYHGPDWHDPNSPKNMRLTACFKMVAAPSSAVSEGVHYLSELHVFREQWPQYQATKF